LTAKGQSDLASRLFLRKIKETLNLPVLGLFDCDPAGLKVRAFNPFGLRPEKAEA
jgi:meiotic recombination protein SPO11